MKKIIYLFLLLSFPLYLNAQWIRLNNIQGGNCIYKNGNDIYLGNNDGVYISTNDGTNWSVSNNGLLNSEVSVLVFDNNNIYANTFKYTGVQLYHRLMFFKSTNNGDNWTLLNNFNIDSVNFVSSMILTNGNIYTSILNRGVYKSTDFGVSWASKNNGLADTAVNVIVSLNGNLYVGTSGYYPNINYGIFKSSNNGDSWNRVFSLTRVYCICTIGNTLFAGTNGYGIYKSTNDGLNWVNTNSEVGPAKCLASSGNNLLRGDATIYNEGGGVFLSTDLGISWIPKFEGLNSPPTKNIHKILAYNTYAFLINDSGVYRRTMDNILLPVKEVNADVSLNYNLSQNYPNPFNPSTTIRYEIPKNGFVKLIVFDILGNKIETLVNEKQTTGIYEATFDASKYSSGVYFYKLTTDNFSESKKMLLIK